MTVPTTNFIEQFVHATRHMAAPEIFRRWCALATVSAAMSRRVWTCIEEDLKLFPNLYVMLVSKPGIGKSRPMEVSKALLIALDPGGKVIAFMPDELTRQEMIHHMGEWFKANKGEGNCVYISLISEFACFMPEPDAGWMQACARLWDCPNMYERATKHCMAVEHRVLTADLRWVPAGSLKVGDRLIGFDEENVAGTGRRYRLSIVEGMGVEEEDTSVVSFSNNQRLIVTPDHKWLTCTGGRNTPRNWTRTDQLRAGGRASRVPLVIPPWEIDKSYDAGWLAGFLDGEGSIRRGGDVTAGQRPGIVLDQALSLLELKGQPFHVHPTTGRASKGLGKGDCMTIRVCGTLADRLSFLGSIRPERLIAKLDPNVFGRMENRRNHLKNDVTESLTVMSVQPWGKHRVAKIQTSTKTLICEGIPMHNCGHDALYTPYVTMLAGVQPAWFAEGFPQNSYEMGLPARMLFIHADVKPFRRFFGSGKQVDGFQPLVDKLHRVAAVVGHVPWTPDAQEAWRDWSDAGMPPIIDNPFLEGYVTRRDMHTAKLALICAVATHPGSPQIKLSDLEQAWTYLREAEVEMPKALVAAGGNIYKRHEEKVIEFVKRIWEQNKDAEKLMDRHVPEAEVRRRLGQTVPTPVIRAIIDELIVQKRLVPVGTAKTPYRMLRPEKEKEDG